MYVFTPRDLGRDEALRAIADALGAVRARVERMGYAASLPRTVEGHEVKLFVQADDVLVKVEVNGVFRGTVLPVERRPLSKAAEQTFSARIDLPVLAPAELYASKLVAALWAPV